MSGLSLWLSPPSSSKLSSFIREQAGQLPTSPAFPSHATLVSDEVVPAGLSTDQLIKRIETGIRSWQAARGGAGQLHLPFKDVRQGDKYFQCVLIKLHDEQDLFKLHESLLAAFDLPVPSPPTYYPHLSLVYGDYTVEEKVRIISDMKAARTVVDIEGGVEVVGESSFTPTEVLLVKTGGVNPEDWEPLARIPL